MSNEPTPLLEVKNLTKHFPAAHGQKVHAVNGVSFKLERGETLGIVGESGCGKSSMGRTILKVHEPTSGQIIFDGVDITGLSNRKMFPYRKKMQMIFQDPYASLNPRFTVGEIIEEPLILNGVKDKEEREKIILDTLSQVGMAPMFLDRYPHQLSGGQRQRIIIARCLVVTPKIIFADEPISALDVSLQAQVINMLMDLQDKYKLSMLLIAHDLAVVRQIADQIKIMYFGEIVESAPSSEIYKNAQHPYTKVLLKAAPSISKGLEDAGFDIDLKPGDIPDPAKPMPGCPFCTRCIYADERCMKERPEETEVSPGHTVRCHKAGQI